ncbi:MAG: PIN domain-containing protein [Pantoea dispersa]|jgi:predicted nucleic acid-binding protein|nr:PIN domain-containing protein [Pantoea dispersa]MBZ6391857.1 PIN domain-containing protein [Pantoea dispersa]
MIHTPFPVVFDACVLYPSPLRDLLMHLGLTDLCQPKWSDDIQDEWTRNLLANNPEYKEEKLARTVRLMNTALPDANVTNYQPIIDGLNLPDPDDRHVLAVAIKSQSEIIVTANLKDFPAEILSPYGIEAMHPDEFIVDLLDLNASHVFKAVNRARTSMSKPPMNVDDYLDCLFRQQLPLTVIELEKAKILL